MKCRFLIACICNLHMLQFTVAVGGDRGRGSSSSSSSSSSGSSSSSNLKRFIT